MNDFVKKLKASTPDLMGQEARDFYFKTLVSRGDYNVIYHSAVHGVEMVLNVIEQFLASYAKIPIYNAVAYSYQPAMIGFFTEDKKMILQDKEHTLDVWFMCYANCFITYQEIDPSPLDDGGPVSDICITIDKKDLDEILNGPQKS